LLIAAVTASGLVAIGAVAAVAVGRQQTGTVTASPMTIGGTATTTTPPSVAPTANASPLWKRLVPTASKVERRRGAAWSRRPARSTIWRKSPGT